MFRLQKNFIRQMSTGSFKEVVIVSAARTPVGKIQGSLASLKASELGSVAISKAVENAGIKKTDVQEVIMGNVVSSGMGQAPCRQAVLGAGLSENTICTTINKVCASGMKSVMMASQAIALGQRDVMIAGGMESMSNVPFYLPKMRTGMAYGHTSCEDGILKDGLWDVYNEIHMGNCGEKTSKDFGITRADQDQYAISSYEKAQNAQKSGKFDKEIAPVTIAGKRGKPDVVINEDEEYAKVNFEKLKQLKSAFQKDGAITAGNASSLNDGAAALVLMSREKADELGVKPLARILSYGDAEIAPIDFSIAPAKATEEALARASLTKNDMSFFEINEAFSVVPLANAKLLELESTKINVNGGAVSIGHPIGCSGARITGHLAHLVNGAGSGTKGCASICNGGGGGSAIILESL